MPDCLRAYASTGATEWDGGVPPGESVHSAQHDKRSRSVLLLLHAEERHDKVIHETVARPLSERGRLPAAAASSIQRSIQLSAKMPAPLAAGYVRALNANLTRAAAAAVARGDTGNDDADDGGMDRPPVLRYTGAAFVKNALRAHHHRTDTNREGVQETIQCPVQLAYIGLPLDAETTSSMAEGQRGRGGGGGGGGNGALGVELRPVVRVDTFDPPQAHGLSAVPHE